MKRCSTNVSEDINVEIEYLPASIHARVYTRPSSLRTDLSARSIRRTYNRRSTLPRSENFREFGLHTKRRVYRWSTDVRKHTLSDICCTLGISAAISLLDRQIDIGDIGLACIPSHSLLNGIFRDRFAERYAPSLLCWLIGLVSDAWWFLQLISYEALQINEINFIKYSKLIIRKFIINNKWNKPDIYCINLT